MESYGGLRIGRIRGIPIEINYTWLLIFTLVVISLATSYYPNAYPELTGPATWTLSVVTALLFFLSVLLHELMHSLVALEHGINIRRITLFMFGGVAQITGEPDNAKTELKVAAVGPLTNLLLGLVFNLGYRLVTMAGLWVGFQAGLLYLSWINFFVAGFNLVPAFPLDGGRVLRAIIWQFSGDLKGATRIAAAFGQGFAYLMFAWGTFLFLIGGFADGLWLMFLGWFLLQAARSSYFQLVLKKALTGVPVRQLMTSDVQVVPPNISVRDLVNNYIYKFRYGGFPVCDGERLLGLVTLHDVREVPQEEWDTTSVQSIMQPANEENTISPDTEAVDAMMKMARENVGRLLVVSEDNRLLGIVSRADIIGLIKIHSDLNL